MQVVIGCGGRIQLSADRPTALITSPNYPNNYPQSVDCTWTVMAPANRKVQLQFIGDIFNIEPHSRSVGVNLHKKVDGPWRARERVYLAITATHSCST